MSVLVVNIITRLYLGEGEQSVLNAFKTSESASQFLMLIFESYLRDNDYPRNWDEGDMCDVEDGTLACAPTMEVAARIFDPSVIRAMIERRRNGPAITRQTPINLYSWFSEMNKCVPFEITIQELTLL